MPKLDSNTLMTVSWTNLRLHNGSQHAAFEELVCQLAAGEPVPEGARFIRIGAPDAGVEAVWILPNGDEWGWQAKFFMSTPGNSQWKQIDESVQTALIKRPRLTRLTICIPLDRQDPRIPNRHPCVALLSSGANRPAAAAKGLPD